MKYIVDGFNFHKEFTTEAEARECFEEAKNGFNRLELKVAEVTPTAYYAKSIEIFRK